jgi:hypothetical protein
MIAKLSQLKHGIVCFIRIQAEQGVEEQRLRLRGSSGEVVREEPEEAVDKVSWYTD